MNLNKVAILATVLLGLSLSSTSLSAGTETSIAPGTYRAEDVRSNLPALGTCNASEDRETLYILSGGRYRMSVQRNMTQPTPACRSNVLSGTLMSQIAEEGSFCFVEGKLVLTPAAVHYRQGRTLREVMPTTPRSFVVTRSGNAITLRGEFFHGEATFSPLPS
jgi:hypothetical protein